MFLSRTMKMNSGNGAPHLFLREMGGRLRLLADEDRPAPDAPSSAGRCSSFR